ncbi:MAG: glycoside hydrolase family 95 protein, partial [Bacteroidota bacterium]|nr:glycoside hydrolase family 95 protein [Bacteroidota bacterium]
MRKKFQLPGLSSSKTYLLLLSLGLISVLSCTEKYELKQPDVKLWYKQPAMVWEEALPVGNGRLGAMVFGQPYTERIQLNEESLWAGQPINNNNPDALVNLDELRTLLFQEKSIEAQRLVALNFLGTPPRIRSYQTAGDIFLTRDSIYEASNYYRDIVLENGIATVKYSLNETKYTQEVFASAPDNVIVIHLLSKGDEGITLRIKLDREKDSEITVENKQIVLTGQIIDKPDPLTGPGGKHMKFASLLNVDQKGGTLTRDENTLRVEGSSEVTLLYTASTDYNIDSLGFDRRIKPLEVCKDIIAKASKKSYCQIKKDHIRDHASIFNRVHICLGKNEISNLPTDQRMKALKEGKDDPDLAALYFQYGRYLLMGSSREPGKLPANLQGVWNHHYKAPWNSDFHTNINLQMNYWPAEVANIPEAQVPLTRFMNLLMIPGGKTAKEMYGTRGWTFHHLTDPFGRTGVMDGPWGLTPLNGPWMTFP